MSNPPHAGSPRPHRPFYLLLAMLLAWLHGVAGVSAALRTIAVLRAPDPERLLAELPAGGSPSARTLLAIEQARIVGEHALAPTLAPLAAAGLVLSAFLLVMCALAISGRPGSRRLTLQALAANAVLLIVAFALEAPVRAATVEAAARTMEAVPPLTTEKAHEHARALLSFSMRLKLGLELALLGAAGFALTRPRSRAFFDEKARAAALAED